MPCLTAWWVLFSKLISSTAHAHNARPHLPISVLPILCSTRSRMLPMLPLCQFLDIMELSRWFVLQVMRQARTSHASSKTSTQLSMRLPSHFVSSLHAELPQLLMQTVSWIALCLKETRRPAHIPAVPGMGSMGALTRARSHVIFEHLFGISLQHAPNYPPHPPPNPAAPQSDPDHQHHAPPPLSLAQ